MDGRTWRMTCFLCWPPFMSLTIYKDFYGGVVQEHQEQNQCEKKFFVLRNYAEVSSAYLVSVFFS